MGGVGKEGMMGGGGSTALSYLWLIPVGLIGLIAVGAIGAAYFIAFPEIKPVTETYEAARSEPVPATLKKEHIAAVSSLSGSQNPVETVSRTLTPEERKVLEVLVAHQGRYLQKYIRREAGLSRLKTHRIIARFAERGMVTVKQSGNTNEILLSSWLQEPKAKGSA
jgi:uncharacterized membrane protein